MTQVVKYMIVTGGNPAELEKKVNEAMAQGWQPLGGVTGGKEGWMFQALVQTK